MKKFTKATFTLLVAALMGAASCGTPNDDSGSQDSNSSRGEGEIDSSRLIQSDSLGASITVPYDSKTTAVNRDQQRG